MKIVYENLLNLINEYNSSPETFDKIGYGTEVLLSEYSSFKIGGPCDVALFPKNERAMIFCLDILSSLELDFYVIGNGSNVLFDDEGIRGAVVFTTKMDSISVEDEKICAECGAGITRISRIALAHSLTGLEFACGIPGSLGGAVYMNAGAYGGEMSNVVVESRCYDIKTKTVKTISGDEHLFGYRESVYLKNPDLFVLKATMKLEKAEYDEIKAVMDKNLSARREKQPLEYPSAGSTFKRYPGYFTGKLIEEAGLKGYAVGGASVSEKHAGFVINHASATSADVKKLISDIKQKIYEKNGIMLECEVRFIGGGKI